MDAVNVVLIGDKRTGKTAFVNRCCHDSFDETLSLQSGIDMKKIERRHHDELITFFLVDTEEGYHSLAYNNAKAFILCYGIDSLDTFKSIPSKWIPELENIPEWPVPFILVALKSDLRDDENYEDFLVTTLDGETLAKRIGAQCYVECSAKTGIKTSKVLEKALLAALEKPIHKQKKTKKGLKKLWK